MPTAAPKPCAACGVLVRDGTARCERHKVLGTGRFGDARRGSRQSRGYGAEWDRTRPRILARDHGLCQPCMRQGLVHEGTEVDHIVGKAEWQRRNGTLAGVDDDSNLQTINKYCHRQKTQREAATARGVVSRPSQACGDDGMPTDASHPWGGRETISAFTQDLSHISARKAAK